MKKYFVLAKKNKNKDFFINVFFVYLITVGMLFLFSFTFEPSVFSLLIFQVYVGTSEDISFSESVVFYYIVYFVTQIVKSDKSFTV